MSLDHNAPDGRKNSACGFVRQLQRQFERARATGMPVQLRQRTDRPRQSDNECSAMEFHLALKYIGVPALVRMPQFLNRTYATLCQLDCRRAVAESSQRV